MALQLELHLKEPVVGCISSSSASKEVFVGSVCLGVRDNEVLLS